MFIIPMLGRSVRFKNAGYVMPKYQLPLGNRSVFDLAIQSFESYFATERFQFIVRDHLQECNFVQNAAHQLGIRHFEIVPLSIETRGQAETVFLGTENCAGDERIVIFNIDTVRRGFEYPDAVTFGDGFLEVFQAEGEGWSFIEPAPDFRVARTAEKERISPYCSNGLYGFRYLDLFRHAFETDSSSGRLHNGEFYIAPLYNSLIHSGLTIKYRLVPNSEITHLGTPIDYEKERVRLKGQ